MNKILYYYSGHREKTHKLIDLYIRGEKVKTYAHTWWAGPATSEFHNKFARLEVEIIIY